ncbi:MAG TPA: signal peptidase II [Rectinema sp.]|jgi:signal peptidase II|nr:signal peptidase II [Spirochaetia bacterium]MDI9428026.1 signal peptidase II [Spirochaetota bacterium]NLH89870.1 signal peptidase II [Treponema sp.]OQC74280.1 MAG: Lipoprotein signal peptidase [Spirochaetes bacterium ADurb.Bin001]HNP93037.1 signal peptidase II [Rectinema sp.]
MKKNVPLVPILFSGIIIIVDQITKALVVKYIPEGRVFARILGDFVWIVHTRNRGAAFSIGALSPQPLRFLFFICLPIVVLIALLFYYFKSERLSPILRYSIGLIVGGGIGNLIDRILRPQGVVDFISVNMYGFLGMERFATFNIADSAITIGEILLILGFLILEFHKPKAQSSQSEKG